MFSKLTGLFKNKANLEEIAYLEAMHYDKINPLGLVA